MKLRGRGEYLRRGKRRRGDLLRVRRSLRLESREDVKLRLRLRCFERERVRGFDRERECFCGFRLFLRGGDFVRLFLDWIPAAREECGLIRWSLDDDAGREAGG